MVVFWLPKKDSLSWLDATRSGSALTCHWQVIHSRPVRILLNFKKIKNSRRLFFCLAAEEGFALVARRHSVRVGSDLPLASHSLPTRSNPFQMKNNHPQKRMVVFWLPKKDSNPHIQSQSLLCYHYTIRQKVYSVGLRMRL